LILAREMSCATALRFQPHDRPDVVVGEQLDLAQREHLPLAWGQPGVGRTNLLARGFQQRLPFGILLHTAGLGVARLGVVGDGHHSAPRVDHVVARVTRAREGVGREVELPTAQGRQAPEHAHERLLGRVGSVVRGPEHPHAEAVHASLVAVVELCKRLTVAGDRASRQIAVLQRLA
jgi:hypothetical protein